VTPIERICSTNLPRAHGFEPLAVDGRIPEDLSGTLYRMGPGLFDRFGAPYAHIFEGDGAVTAIRIGEGRAFGASRILRTSGLLEESAARRPLYGSAASWGRRFLNVHAGRRKNTANTNIVGWDGSLLALMEAGRPTVIDPDDLGTRGETDLGGVVRGPLAAHPHRVPARRSSYGYGVHYGRRTRIELYALPDAGPARHLGTLPLRAPPMLHDFMATERHLVFFVPPAVASVPRMMLQIGTFADAWMWKPEMGAEIIVVPIDAPDRPIRFRTDPFFQWHFANGFDRDGRIVVDFLHYPTFDSFGAIGRKAEEGRGGTYRRAMIDPGAERIELAPILEVPADFPRIHPSADARPHRSCLLATEESPQRLLLLDVESGDTEGFTFDREERTSEAVIAPAGDRERDGYALAIVYDARRGLSHLAVFDLRAIAAGPIARAWFDHLVPITFHGSWIPAP
jgi:all-trans-8'-apo-beta-carotenal 15,15'-oxygenase